MSDHDDDDCVIDTDDQETVVKRMLDAYVARTTKSPEYLRLIDDAIERAKKRAL